MAKALVMALFVFLSSLSVYAAYSDNIVYVLLLWCGMVFLLTTLPAGTGMLLVTHGTHGAGEGMIHFIISYYAFG